MSWEHLSCQVYIVLTFFHGISCQVPNSQLAGEVTFNPDKQPEMFFKAVFEVFRLVAILRVHKFVHQPRNL